MACTVFEGKGQRRSRSEEDLQSQHQQQQTSSISYVPNNVIHPDHDHPNFHQYQSHHNPNILGDFVVSSSQRQQQLASHPHENGNGNGNGNDSDDWLNDNFSDLELDAEIHEKPNSKLTRTATAQLGMGKGLNPNKADADNSDTENNTENDNSISELDHDYEYEHDCDYDDCDHDYTFDNDEKGFLEATKLHQVGYFNPDGMPYSHRSHGMYTMQDNNDTGTGGNVNSNSNDETKLVENDCKNYSQQLAQLLRTGNGNGNPNSCTESSDEDIIIKNAFHYDELMDCQGGHDDQFQYGFKIDPTLDDDGCLEELDDPPFYTVMDAFHAYTMQKRVTEANQKWGTGSGSNADKISSQTDLNPDSEAKIHSNYLRKIKVQFSERVELYSVETPTDDDESDDNGGTRLNSSTESQKKTTANSRVPVVHVKELRLEDESYKSYKIAQIKSKEVPETEENLTIPEFINTSHNNNFPELYASADTDLIPTSRNLPVISEVSYKVSEAGFLPVSVPLPVVGPAQNLPILPDSEFEFHKALSSPSPSTFPSTTVVGRAAESLSFNINVGQSGQPMTLERHVASAPTLTKSKKLTKTKSTKAQPATPLPPALGPGSAINNIKFHAKLKKKNQQSAGMSVTEAPISSAETHAHLQKEREFQAKLAETILALRKLDRAADSSFIGIGDQSIRRIYTPGSSSIQSSATASKSHSQEKLLPWKRTDSQSHGHGGGSFTFTTASETYKLGNQNKNSSTFSSFPPPPPSQIPHPCSDAETSIGLGPSKLNPILQSILDPKNLDLLTKCCNPNNPIFKELKAQILKHNVPKTFLQTRLNKKMINLLFDHPNHITQSHKHKDSKDPNPTKNDSDSHKTNNISSKTNPTPTPTPTPTTVVNVSNLNFQKETLSSKSKNSVQISNLKNSKKFKHAGKYNDRRDKSKSKNCISAPTSNNPFPGDPPNTVNHNACHNTSANCNTNTNARNGSKWASRPELLRPTTLAIPSSSSPPIRKQEETLNQNQSTRKYVRKRTPTPAPVKSQNQSHSHRVLDVNSTIIKPKLMTQKEFEIRVRQPTAEKIIVEDHERKKSKLEMGFHALSLHNNCHAIIASTALANSSKPKRAPSFGLGLTIITSPRTRNKYELPSNSSNAKPSSKNQISTSNFTTLQGSVSDSGSRHPNPISLNRKVKCAS